MSTPAIDGWIEVRRPAPDSAWEGVVRLDPIADVPVVPVYACLFYPDDMGFEPIAFNRGIPLDASPDVRNDVAADNWAYPIFHTWILWTEIRDMDWDEIAPFPQRDAPAAVYTRGPDGELVFQEWNDSQGGWWPGREEELEVDGTVFRFERLSRRRAIELQPEWRMLIGFMAQLAELFRPENVRMTVWFGADYVPWKDVAAATSPVP